MFACSHQYMLAAIMMMCWLQSCTHVCMQMMQRRTAAAEHALKKAELRVRSAELRAQSAESELAQLRKAHAVSAHAFFHDVCDVAGASNSSLYYQLSYIPYEIPDVFVHTTYASQMVASLC